MHWAAREQIRLEVMKSLIKNRKGIVAYNKMVDNYNKRASSFKYRDNTWPMAKADVEKHRDEIVEDAKNEVHEMVGMLIWNHIIVRIIIIYRRSRCQQDMETQR